MISIICISTLFQTVPVNCIHVRVQHDAMILSGDWRNCILKIHYRPQNDARRIIMDMQFSDIKRRANNVESDPPEIPLNQPKNTSK